MFAGGCFFDAVRSEYDSRRPGPVRDAILDEFGSWSRLVADMVRAAQRAGHLDPGADPQQVAFELDALGGGAERAATSSTATRRSFDRARRAVRERLDALAARR